MPVWDRPLDLKVLVEIDQPAPGEHRADRVDHLQRQMRQVAQVLVANLAALAVGAAQQIRRVLPSAATLRRDLGYVGLAATPRHHKQYNTCDSASQAELWLQNAAEKKPDPRQHGRSGSRPTKTSVRQPRSTREAGEQGRGIGGGVGGGKAAGQGEHGSANRAPDAEPGRERVKCAG